MSGKGHPLPGSDEARHNEIPEEIESGKGRGDDAPEVVQPAPEAVAPDGTPYRYDDLGRGPDHDRKDDAMADDRREDAGEDLPRNQEQGGAATHGRQVGGGPGASDMASPGGSSGSGGYGNAQNQQFHQGQDPSGLGGRRSDQGLDRGARFDEQQGGGRGDDEVTVTSADIAEDQRAHQDRGQGDAEGEVEDR